MVGDESKTFFSLGEGERLELWSERHEGQDLVHLRLASLGTDGEWRGTGTGFSLSPAMAVEVAVGISDRGLALWGLRLTDKTRSLET